MQDMNDSSRRALVAFVDTVVPAVQRPDDPTGFWGAAASAGGVHVAVERHLETRVPEGARAGLLQLLTALEHAGLVAGDREARERLVTAVAASSPPAAAGIAALRSLTLMLAHGMPDAAGRNVSWDVMGYPGLVGTPKPAGTRRIRPLVPDGDTTLHCDVCVVGSGAGGGVIAGVLAAAGRRVVVLESGGHYDESDFAGSELQAYDSMYYRHGPFNTADGALGILAGATLGGGTTVNWTNAVRPPAWVREEWARDFGLSGLDTADFDRHLEAVSDRASVNDRCSEYNGPQQRLAEGCERLGFPLDRGFRNADPERHDPVLAGYVGFGDPSGSKQGTLSTYLRDAYDAGARILVRCRADRVLVEAGRAVGVTATYVDESGRRVAVEVRAPRVVVAGGSLESPALLLRSGIGGPAVGWGLHVHPASAVLGVYDDEQDPWWGPPQTAICRQFADRGDGHGFLLEGMQFAPAFLAAVIPWRTGAEHKDLVARLGHTSPLIFLLRDHGEGRVTIDEAGEAVPEYSLADERDRGNWADAMTALIRIHAAAGAREIYTPAYSLPRWRRGEDLETFVATVRAIPPEPGGQPVFSAHQLGTCRMGPDPQTSVADPRGQLHDVAGVWIGDGSALPTAPGVNPMLTIMALAHRTAEHLLGAGGSGPAAVPVPRHTAGTRR